MGAKEGLALGRIMDEVGRLFLFIPLVIWCCSALPHLCGRGHLTGDAYVSSSQPTKNFGKQTLYRSRDIW